MAPQQRGQLRASVLLLALLCVAQLRTDAVGCTIEDIPLGEFEYSTAVIAANCGRIESDARARLREDVKSIANVASLFTSESQARMRSFAAANGGGVTSGSYSDSQVSASSQFITFAGCRWIPAFHGCTSFRQTCCRNGRDRGWGAGRAKDGCMSGRLSGCSASLTSVGDCAAACGPGSSSGSSGSGGGSSSGGGGVCGLALGQSFNVRAAPCKSAALLATVAAGTTFGAAQQVPSSCGEGTAWARVVSSTTGAAGFIATGAYPQAVQWRCAGPASNGLDPNAALGLTAPSQARGWGG